MIGDRIVEFVGVDALVLPSSDAIVDPHDGHPVFPEQPSRIVALLTRLTIDYGTDASILAMDGFFDLVLGSSKVNMMQYLNIWCLLSDEATKKANLSF